MHAKMNPVLSSNIAGYLYLPGEKLVIAFLSGKVYSYDGVPKRIVDEFATAGSKGTYFNAHIKDAFFCTRLLNEDLEALLGTSPTPARKSRPTPEQTRQLQELALRYPFLQMAF